MKRALVIGIDDYPDAPLTGCVNDALAVAKAVGSNGDGGPNFSVEVLASDKTEVSGELIRRLYCSFSKATPVPPCFILPATA